MKTSSYWDMRRLRRRNIRSPDQKADASTPKGTLRDRIEGYFVAFVVTIYLKLT
jgi:hypothetical protein